MFVAIFEAMFQVRDEAAPRVLPIVRITSSYQWIDSFAGAVRVLSSIRA